ncbi:MAG TPA: Mur ligase family protein, partial [Flavisolibacter sp.]|nr:Mur ligase family protein [Flavisolibacter sp.]
LQYFIDKKYRVVKRSDVLQVISSGSFNICVAGTHGKTTISTMIAHILRESGYGCNAFLGGISVNYHTNFWSSKRDVCVIEADEYDRSFLKLNPDMAIITAMDPDHLDIYGNEQAMQDAFVDFGNKVKAGGFLLSKLGLKRIKEITVGNRQTYSLQNDAADAFAFDIKMEHGGYRFNVQLGDKIINGIELNIGGMHNIENAVAAISIANRLKIEEGKIKSAVSLFKGVKRRFEYIIPPRKENINDYIHPVLVDDYAHHPEELRALLTSIRSLFPQRTVTVIFQPHLFTRTRDLSEGFAEALSIADRVILLPVYPARELPIQGVTSKLILDKVQSAEKYLLEKEELLTWMEDHIKHIDKEFGEIVVMAGAGNIDALVQPLKNIIEQGF